MKYCFLFFVLICGPALSDDTVYIDQIQVTSIESVYDADTFRVNVPGWPRIIGESMPIRLNGIDGPEIRGKCDEEKAAAKAA